MTIQKTFLLIFNNQGTCLGELFFEHDRFVKAYLHPEGESILGDWLLDWQVTGINYCQKTYSSGNNRVCALSGHVSMRSPEFPAALRAWLEQHGFFSLPLPESAWRAWNIIQQLPLLPNENYKMAQVLAESDSQDKERITALLQELLQELESPTKSQKEHKFTKATKQSQSKKSSSVVKSKQRSPIKIIQKSKTLNNKKQQSRSNSVDKTSSTSSQNSKKKIKKSSPPSSKVIKSAKKISTKQKIEPSKSVKSPKSSK